MADFDWRTEDEETWPVETEAGEPQKKRPSWLYPVLILIVVAVSAGAVYALIARRAEAAEEAIKADVRRTHELVLEAAESQDVELFTTFLSGADDRWLSVQREAVRRGRFDESSWLGFYLDEERPYRLDEITLSPDLDEAVVTYTRWYEKQQTGASIPLQQTAVYRRGEDRWLLAPPTAEFWGDTGTFREDEITISYSERDERHVLRLSDSILSSIPGICNSLPTRSCPDGWRLRLTLSNDPETIINPTTIDGPIGALEMSLPAPTLLGAPLDNAGYNLMYLNYRLALERRLGGVMIRYIAERPELTPPELEVSAPVESAADASSVLNSLPDADLIVSCSSGSPGRENWSVLAYSLRTGIWSQLYQRNYSGEDGGTIFPLENGDGLVIQEFLRDDLQTTRLLLRQEGETILVAEETVNFDNALRAPYFAGELDPTGRYLLIGTSEGSDDSWFLLDRESCGVEAGCEMEEVLNIPIWSPDGEQMLLEEPLINAPTFRPLYRADKSGQNLVEIGVGATPFWVDEQTYGYGRLNDDDEMELVLADSVDDDARVLLKTADLMPLVLEERDWVQMLIWDVWVNPQMMLLMTTPTGRQNSGPYDFFLVQADPSDNEELQIEWLFSDEFPASPGLPPFSPDGRYLLPIQRGSPLFTRDLETGDAFPFDEELGFVVNWSPDGRFYVQRSDEALTLTSPETGYQARIFYDFAACLGPQWREN